MEMIFNMKDLLKKKKKYIGANFTEGIQWDPLVAINLT